MRVSDTQRFHSFSTAVEERLSNFVRIQQELAEGRSIFRPSEDVQMAKQAMRTKADLAANEQYVRNINDGKNFVASASARLQDVIDLLSEIDSLALASDNSSQSEQDRHNSAIHMNQKIESLMEAVNAHHGDRFLFGGFNTDSPPFSVERNGQERISGVSVNQDTIGGQIYRRIGRDEDLQVNIPGNRLFQPSGEENSAEDLFYVVTNLRDVIDNNNVPPEGQEETLANNVLREQLSQIRDRIINEQTYLGSAGQRLDQKMAYYQEIEIALTEELEDAQGADITELVSRLAIEENVYNSLLAINSRILSRSLVDYLG